MNNIFWERTIALIGEEAFQLLNKSTVAIFGLGGVGGYALEAIVRSGVGNVYIYDYDVVKKNNFNRQIIATNSNLEKLKIEVSGNRMRDINPTVNIIANGDFINSTSSIAFEKFDYVIDAIDTVSSKLYLIRECIVRNVPIISSMGTGNKMKPELFEITNIKNTSVCPLARVIRKELRNIDTRKLMVVYSKEIPKKITFGEKGRHIPASSPFVPPVAGFLLASYVIRQLIHWKESYV